MHPYWPGFHHHWYRMHHWHYGPSRFFWFIIGATTATLWIKLRECANHGRYFGHCYRVPIQAPPSSYQAYSSTADGSSSSPPRSIPEAINRIPPAEDSLPWTFGQHHQAQRWEEEKEKMWELGRQAGDAMTELSESTLDSVLTTVEALKTKLAEHRARREEQRKKIDKRLEEEKKQPFRWV